MTLVEGLGDDVTVAFLVFTGAVAFFLWKICFRYAGSEDETILGRQREMRRQAMNFDSFQSDNDPVSRSHTEDLTNEANDEGDNENTQEIPEFEDGTNTIMIKLRHGETERMARIRSDQTVGELKR
jgi:hypothetical protein